MKKLLAVLVACATMTCAFVSCGKDEEADESKSSKSESSVSETETSADEETTEEDTTEEETTEEETTEEETTESEEDKTDSTKDKDAKEDDEEEEPATEAVTYEINEDIDTSAFLGKWQGDTMVAEDGTKLDNIMGIPVYAFMQFEFKDDGTLAVNEEINLVEAEEAEVFTWGAVSETEIVIISDDGEQELLMLEDDGRLVMFDTTGGTEAKIYLVKVDKFTEFDMDQFLSDFQFDLGEDLAEEETKVSE